MTVKSPGESSEYRAARDRLLEQEIGLRRAMEACTQRGSGDVDTVWIISARRASRKERAAYASGVGDRVSYRVVDRRLVGHIELQHSQS
jgi:uncharacterized DUF497 family protein